MTLSIIVAMTEEGVIGKDNKLPWHLSEDLKRFKSITIGHPIIMGRKTFESIGKPLPGRQNIVVTNNKNYEADGVTIAHNLCEALALSEQNVEEKFVIGGASLFAEALPQADRIYLTLINHFFKGDVFFPEFDEGNFAIKEKSDHQTTTSPIFNFEFLVLERKSTN